MASTRGTGELLRSALDAGVRRVILGLGGSATTDGGSGMLAALGVRFLDMAGATCSRAAAALAELIVIDPSGLDPRLARVEVVVASDVTNPLTGPAGAAATYGPQKGADADAVTELDAALGIYGDAIEATTGRAVAELPGAGAAGGTGAALLGFTNATLRPGVEVVAEMAGLAATLEGADLLITGEGRADEQTLAGKAAMGVALLAGKRAIPVVLLCGTLGPGSEALEVSGLFELIQPVADRPMTLEEAMADTDRLLTNAAERLARQRRDRAGAGRSGDALDRRRGPSSAEARRRPTRAQAARRRRPRAARRAVRPPDLGGTARGHGQRAGAHHPFPEHRRHELVPRLHRAARRATPAGPKCWPRHSTSSRRCCGRAAWRPPSRDASRRCWRRSHDATHGSWDLSFLGEWPLEEARAWLMALPGIGRKTAAIVLLFGFGRPALPVDTHVHRVALRLGLIPPRTDVERAHLLLEAALQPDEMYPFHVELIRHGRDTCRAPRPICGLCPLTDVCPYFELARRGQGADGTDSARHRRRRRRASLPRRADPRLGAARAPRLTTGARWHGGGRVCYAPEIGDRLQFRPARSPLRPIRAETVSRKKER